MNVDKQLSDVQYKINVVKENRNNKYKHPRDILAILSLREMELSDQLYFLKS